MTNPDEITPVLLSDEQLVELADEARTHVHYLTVPGSNSFHLENALIDLGTFIAEINRRRIATLKSSETGVIWQF